jgi:hypothetical protein
MTAYADVLREYPADGNGGHPYMMTVANHGFIEGVDPDTVERDLQDAVYRTGRPNQDKEIRDTIRKAWTTCRSGNAPTAWTPRRQLRQDPKRIDGDYLRRRIIERGAGMGEADMHDWSPVRLPDTCVNDTALLLSELYQPHEFLYIGPPKYRGDGSQHVRTVAEWLDLFATGHAKPETIVPNPLTGDIDTTGGKPSVRTSNTVADMRFAVVEFDSKHNGMVTPDDLPADEQFQFWCGIELPLAALIYSGGKSIHCWVRVDLPDAGAWEREIRAGLYRKFLEPMGVDSANKNPATLSRLPGVQRFDTGRMQRLLYLAPEGRPIL